MAFAKLIPARDTASIADMAPWYCWMSNHLLGQDASTTIADDRLRDLAQDALAKFIAMPVVDSFGEPCVRPS